MNRIICVTVMTLQLSIPAARGEELTFADLDGAVVEARFVRERMNRIQGREFEVRVDTDVKLVIGPGERIERTIAITMHTPRGIKKSPTEKSVHALEKPTETLSRGGGHGVFVFVDGALTAMRTFKSGGLRLTIAFSRGEQSLTCNATQAYARENGVDRIVLENPIDGLPTVILSSKQISSTCQVTLPKTGATHEDHH